MNPRLAQQKLIALLAQIPAVSISVSKGFHLAAKYVGATKRLLVAPVAISYPMRDAIEVMNPLTAARLLAEQ